MRNKLTHKERMGARRSRAAGRVPVSLSEMTLQRKLGSWKEGIKTKAKQNREGTCTKRRRTKPKGKEEWVYLRTHYDSWTDRGGGDDSENTFKVLTSEPVTLTVNKYMLKTKIPPLSSVPGCFPTSITCWYNHFPCRQAAEHGWACRTCLSLLGNAFLLPPELISHSFLLAQHYTPLL